MVDDAWLATITFAANGPGLTLNGRDRTRMDTPAELDPASQRCAQLLSCVFRSLLPLQPLIHPADDVLQALDAMPRLARS
jgi:hypothetical protein